MTARTALLAGGPPGWELTSRRTGGFLTELKDAVRDRQPFNLRTGLPEAGTTEDEVITWHEHARRYAEAEWAALAPVSRRSVAESLVTVTIALAMKEPGAPEPRVLRLAVNCDGDHGGQCVACDATGTENCPACQGEGRLYDRFGDDAGPCAAGCDAGRVPCTACAGTRQAPGGPR